MQKCNKKVDILGWRFLAKSRAFRGSKIWSHCVKVMWYFGKRELRRSPESERTGNQSYVMTLLNPHSASRMCKSILMDKSVPNRAKTGCSLSSRCTTTSPASLPGSRLPSPRKTKRRPPPPPPGQPGSMRTSSTFRLRAGSPS